jgi:hypothetical protein
MDLYAQGPAQWFYRGADALKGDLSGLGRAAAILVGLSVTTAGYLWGTIANRFTPASQSSEGSLRNDLRRDVL